MKKGILFFLCNVIIALSLTGCMAEWLNDITGSKDRARKGYEKIIEENGGVVTDPATINKGNLSFNFDHVSKTLYIDRLSPNGNSEVYLPEDYKNSYIIHIVIGEGITFIPSRAFDTLHELQSLTLPNTIDNIGDSIFADDYNSVYPGTFDCKNDPKFIVVKCFPQLFENLKSRSSYGDENWRNGASICLLDCIKNDLMIFYDYSIYVTEASLKYQDDIYSPYAWSFLDFDKVSFGYYVRELPAYAFQRQICRMPLRYIALPPYLNRIEQYCFYGQHELMCEVVVHNTPYIEQMAFADIGPAAFLLEDPSESLIYSLEERNFAWIYDGRNGSYIGKQPEWKKIAEYNHMGDNNLGLNYYGRNFHDLSFRTMEETSYLDSSETLNLDVKNVYLEPSMEFSDYHNFSSFNGEIFLKNISYENLYVYFPDTLREIKKMDICQPSITVNGMEMENPFMRPRFIRLEIPYDMQSIENINLVNATSEDYLYIFLKWDSTDLSILRDLSGLDNLLKNNSNAQIEILYQDGVQYTLSGNQNY